MSKKVLGWLAGGGALLLLAGAAWAGGGGNAPGGAAAGAGGGAPEPEMYALIVFSLLPGVFFARRALARRENEEV